MPRQLVVIDPRVVNYQELIDQLGSNYSFLLLSEGSDGLAQLANYVAVNSSFHAVCLVPRRSPRVSRSVQSLALPSVAEPRRLRATPTITPTE